jgi:uncharacterized protein HemY
MGNSAESFRELRVAVQLDPDNYDFNVTLGRLLSMDGKSADGLLYLRKAAQLKPDSSEPHLFLADAYEQLGRQMEATAQRLESERLQGEQKP